MQTGDKPESRSSQLAAALRKCAGEVTQTFVDSLCAERGADAARQLSLDPPQLLSQIADRLEAGPSTIVPDAAGPAASMIRAVSALRQAVLTTLRGRLKRALDAQDLAAIDAVLHDVLAAKASAVVDRELFDLRSRDEAQARYMSFLSHDLRGSLNGLVLMLEVLRRELAPRGDLGEAGEDIELMRRSVLDAVSMMERYVQADRLRRGRVPVKRQVVELSSIIRAADAQVSDNAREKRIDIDTDVPAGAVADADPDLARVALVNLLENAIKYSEAGPVRVSARPRNGAWEITVQDRGPGIAPDRLEKLLDPLRRSELKERGIGLILSQNAAKAQGGHIEAQSTPGAGSTFRLILPAPPGQ